MECGLSRLLFVCYAIIKAHNRCAMPKLKLTAIGLKVSNHNQPTNRGLEYKIAWVIDTLSQHEITQFRFYLILFLTGLTRVDFGNAWWNTIMVYVMYMLC